MWNPRQIFKVMPLDFCRGFALCDAVFKCGLVPSLLPNTESNMISQYVTSFVSHCGIQIHCGKICAAVQCELWHGFPIEISGMRILKGDKICCVHIS